MPAVVLTGSNDEELARELVQQGAQDYLLKTSIKPHLLAASLGHAIEARTNASLRVLIVEDSEDDAMAILREVQRGG